jgi:hypothetical protein
MALEYLRSFKIAGFAVFDFVVSVIAMYYLAGMRGIAGTVPLSILAHWIFDVDTALTRAVGL